MQLSYQTNLKKVKKHKFHNSKQKVPSQKYQFQNRRIYNQMLTIQKIRKTVTRIDMFSSSEMLRYSEDAQYHTFTGGLISLGVIFTVIAGFFSMISQTINKTAITYSLNARIESNPSAYNLTTNADNMIMFGIQLQSVDLSFNYDFNGPRRYFDLVAHKYILSYGMVSQTFEEVPLVQCTDEHWKMLPQIVSKKDKIMYDAWLCPPLDSKYLLQGSYFSEIFSTLSISLKECTNSSNPSRPCYPQNEIDDLFTKYGNFYFTINYLNTVINPGEVSYLSYYLESNDFAIISTGAGSELYYQFSDYQIQTDTSIWPFSSFQYNKGALISHRVPPRPYSMGTSPIYIAAYISKSSQSLRYRRFIQKLSLVISYMGGLVGAICAVLFILKAYTDLSLEVSIAKSVFTLSRNQNHKNIKSGQAHSTNDAQQQVHKEKDKIQQKGFNIFIFIKLLLYRFFKDFRFTEGWTEPKQIQVLRQEISKHLDIKILLQRLTNLQRCLSYLYDDDQLKCLKYLKKINLDEVKEMRTIFSNEIQEDEEIFEQTQSLNQLYAIKMDDNLEQKQIPNSNLFQSLSPENIMNVDKIISFPKQESVGTTKAKSKNYQLALGKKLPQKKSNEGFLNKRTISCFNNLQKMKYTDTISNKIWQNLDEKVKEQFANKGGRRVTLYENKEKDDKNQERKLSYLHVQLPSIIMEKKL